MIALQSITLKNGSKRADDLVPHHEASSRHQHYSMVIISFASVLLGAEYYDKNVRSFLFLG